MPTNLYGPGDNYHPTNSHVIPALIRKFHEARQRGDAAVTVWGTGTPRREFLYSDDMADACVHLMSLPDERYTALLGSDESVSGRFEPPLVNIGVGHDLTIAELATAVARTVGFAGRIEYDASKPDGTPRKLMDVGLINAAGWKASTPLDAGLAVAYAEFKASAAG
jgi:GDP-L-fucose synthase